MSIDRQMWIHVAKAKLADKSRRSFPFMPGLLLLLLGAVILIAPRFVMAVFAMFFIFLGVLFCYLAWKFMRFRKQLSSLTRELDGRIQVQAFHIRTPDTEPVEPDSKKIIYH